MWAYKRLVGVRWDVYFFFQRQEHACLSSDGETIADEATEVSVFRTKTGYVIVCFR